MRTKEISIAALLNKLTNAPRNSKVVLTTQTAVKMNKFGKDEATDVKIPNPFLDAVQKVAITEGEIKFNYMDLVNRQRIVEGKQATFIPDNRVWGDSDGALVSKPDGSIYLNVHVKETKTLKYLHNGIEVDKAAFNAFMPPYNPTSRQGVTETVNVKTYKLASIKEAIIGATHYIIK